MEGSQGSGPAARPALSPMDIQQKEFRVSRFGGYKMRDVDEFLDQVTDSLSALIAETEELRSRADGLGMSAENLDDASRKVEEILEQAREEAARIVADARTEAQAGSVEKGAKAITADDRTAISAFLTRERVFLESLAKLVQEHAEAMKAMARDARSRTSPVDVMVPEAEPEPEPEPAGGLEASADVEASEASDPEAADAEGSSEPGQPTVEIERGEAPIDISSPRAVSTTRQSGSPGAPGVEGSLRELFWGED